MRVVGKTTFEGNFRDRSRGINEQPMPVCKTDVSPNHCGRFARILLESPVQLPDGNTDFACKLGDAAGCCKIQFHQIDSPFNTPVSTTGELFVWALEHALR